MTHSAYDTMHAKPKHSTGAEIGPCDIIEPAEQTLAMVFASPHSGRAYPADFIAQSRLDAITLRKSEDCFVDEIFAVAPECGAPLLRALFPRAYVDANRGPFELDPEMFADPLPAYVRTRTPLVAAGLGTIARCVAHGQDIYGARLQVADALQRIQSCYRPYHHALATLVEQTLSRFGACIVIDCHSMPSAGPPWTSRPGRLADIVLGDRHGTSCAPSVMDAAHTVLADLGYDVARNMPYAGGYTTRLYGRPADGVHALQIEINRALYMDESSLQPTDGLSEFPPRIRQFISALSTLSSTDLIAGRKRGA